MTEPRDVLADLEAVPTQVRNLASAAPDQLALTSIDERRSVTWSELHTESLLWAAALRRTGLEVGSAVSSMVPQSVIANVVWLGISWAGGIEFGINVDYKGAWLVHALNTSGSATLVVDVRFLAAVEAVAAELPHLRRLVVCSVLGEVGELPRRVGNADVLSADEFVADTRPKESDRTPEVSDIACAIYTSGTTGASKAVMMPWGQIAAFAAVFPEEQFDRSEQVYFVPFSAFHLSGKGALARPVRGGRAVVREKMSISGFWDDIRGHGCTWTWIVPLLGHVLRKSPCVEGEQDNPMQLAFVGPNFPYIDDLKARFGFEAYSTYGLTETANPFYLPPHRTTSANFRSSGLPLPGVDAAVVDAKDNELPWHEAGELLLRSRRPWVMSQGYYGKPEESFRSWRNGWFHTGDRFRRNEAGEFEFIDRMKDAIRRRGENISSMELEGAALLHPGVKECAAVAVPAVVGDDEVLIVVVRADVELTPPALIEELAPRVPRFAVPRFVRFVDTLPRTQATGRVQKFLLRDEGITADTWDREAVVSVAPLSMAPTTAVGTGS